MRNIVFLNGRFLPANEAMVSIFDRGFTYGDGLFETIRSYQGKIFAFDLHWERLTNGVQAIGIPFRPGKRYLSECIEKLLRLNNLTASDAYIRLTITRGIDFARIIPAGSLKPSVAIIAKPLEAKIKHYQQHGISAILLASKRNLPHIKSLNLLPNVMGLIEAKRRKAQEGIFTDGNKILEGTVTNIFIADGKGIKTPPIEDGILPGITRRLVIELARREGIKVSEVSLTKKELKDCKEAFLTNSIMEITPLIRIEDTLIGGGTIGVLTKRFQQRYNFTVLNQVLA